MNKVSEFIEKYHPNYSSSNDVAKWNDIALVLEGLHTIGWLHNKYKVTYLESLLPDLHNQIQDKLFKEAYEHFIEIQKDNLNSQIMEASSEIA